VDACSAVDAYSTVEERPFHLCFGEGYDFTACGKTGACVQHRGCVVDACSAVDAYSTVEERPFRAAKAVPNQ
jgi:hypothetical protein